MRARAITAGLKAVGYAPTAGAYDDVSEELPPVAGASRMAPVATTTDRRADLLTLCDIDEAIQELAFVSREDAKVAASQYEKLKTELEGSEGRAQRFLVRLRKRIETAAAVGTSAPGAQPDSCDPPIRAAYRSPRQIYAS